MNLLNSKTIKVFTFGLSLGLATTSFAQDEQVSVSPISDTSKSAVGLYSAQVAGLPKQIWAGYTEKEIIDVFARPTTRQTFAEIDLVKRLALARLEPSASQNLTSAVLLSRLDYLISVAALDQSEALLVAANVDSPALFNRWFETSLLLGHPDLACAPLSLNGTLAQGIDQKTYCSAQFGDWRRAEIALVSGQLLGLIDETLYSRLATFLDPELFEGDPAPDVLPRSALEYTLHNILHDPLPISSLPTAFLPQELKFGRGWKRKVTISERLAAVGSLAPVQYLSILNEGEASASGGVWDRLTRVQRALDDPNQENLSNALNVTLEKGLAPVLTRLLTQSISERLETSDAAKSLALLNPDPDLRYAAAQLLPKSDPRRMIVLGEAENISSLSLEIRAVVEGIAQALPATHQDQGIVKLRIADALNSLGNDLSNDPNAIRQAFHTLRRAGLNEDALRIGLELLTLSQRES